MHTVMPSLINLAAILAARETVFSAHSDCSLSVSPPFLTGSPMMERPIQKKSLASFSLKSNSASSSSWESTLSDSPLEYCSSEASSICLKKCSSVVTATLNTLQSKSGD